MANNFKRMMILHKGRYYEIDKKPEFHQAACKHKFIKAQIVKTADDILRLLVGETEVGGTLKGGQAALKLSKDLGMDKLPIGRLRKSVNLCKKCGKIKVRNN